MATAVVITVQVPDHIGVVAQLEDGLAVAVEHRYWLAGGQRLADDAADQRHVGRSIGPEPGADGLDDILGQQFPAAVVVLAVGQMEPADVLVAEEDLRAAQWVCLRQHHHFARDLSGLGRGLQPGQQVVQDQHAGGFVGVQRGVHVDFRRSGATLAEAKHAQVKIRPLKIALKFNVFDANVSHASVFPRCRGPARSRGA